MTRIAAVKGFHDVVPPESELFDALEAEAVRVLRAAGFNEVRVPVVERTELFARSLGETTDIVEKEMYTFADRDGTLLTLRPEATAGVVRAYLDAGLAQRGSTARLFYRGPMFRRERPQRGRLRQFYQLGAEVLGRNDPLADAEVLVVAAELVARVGARGTVIELNSLGCTACRPAYRQRLATFAQDRRESLCPDCHRRLERNPLRILDCKQPACRRVVGEAPVPTESLCAECASHFAEVRALVEAAGLAYRLNARLVRGLDYYCRTAFEIIAEGLGAQNAVGGGGRYDGLVAALGGPPIAGVGFALGVERLLMSTGRAAAGVGAKAPPVAVLPLEPRAVGPALVFATAMRRGGVAVSLEPPGRSLRALLRSANREGARLAVLIGADELESSRATVRDLERSEDHRRILPLCGDLAPSLAWIRARLGIGS